MNMMKISGPHGNSVHLSARVLIFISLMAIVLRAINFVCPVAPFVNTSIVSYMAMGSSLIRDAIRLSLCWLSATFGLK